MIEVIAIRFQFTDVSTHDKPDERLVTGALADVRVTTLVGAAQMTVALTPEELSQLDAVVAALGERAAAALKK